MQLKNYTHFQDLIDKWTEVSSELCDSGCRKKPTRSGKVLEKLALSSF
jgi:hypothetical protein